MKTLACASFILFLALGPSLRADIPAAFDPRPGFAKFKGSAFLVDTIPRKSCYLILTAPFDKNPEDKFFTYRAILSPKLKNDASVVLGQFVMIEVRRIPKDKKTGATFEITSVKQILNW